jgi:hypothetical protein
VHPSIHPSAHPSIRQLCMLFLHVPPRPSRDDPAPAARCSSFAVGRRNITCHATPSHPRLSPCAYSSTRGAGASPDPAAILAPRWLRWVAAAWETGVCVAVRVCTCICICGYPFGICMRRSGATREVLLFRDAGSGVTGRMPRGCGTGEERTMVLMFKGWIVTITSMSCATNGIRITGIVLQRK